MPTAWHKRVWHSPMRNPLAASNLLDLITLILYLRKRKFHQREQLHGQVASPKSYSTHLSCRVTLRDVYLTSLTSGGCVCVCSHLHRVCSEHEQCLCHAPHRYNMSAGKSSGISKRWRDNGGLCFRLPLVWMCVCATGISQQNWITPAERTLIFPSPYHG